MMRTYTIIFKDKERQNQTVKAEDVELLFEEEAQGVDSNAVALNFLVPDDKDSDNQVSVAYVPFIEVLAVVS